MSHDKRTTVPDDFYPVSPLQLTPLLASRLALIGPFGPIIDR